MIHKPQTRGQAALPRQRGVSLIEVMVSITIGMLVVAAMALLFANNSRVRAETERASTKIENGRYALELLSTELQHAGFLGSLNPREVPLPAAKPPACSTDIPELTAAIVVPLLGVDNMALANALSCISGYRSGADVVVIRRAATCANGAAGCMDYVAGAPVFQASSCSSSAELGGADPSNWFRLGTSTAGMDLHRRDCTTTAELRKYFVRIYFVAPNDSAGDGIPTLKRAELGAGGFTTVSLVHGIEDLQVEYGLDTDADGDPDVYSPDPDRYCAAAATPIAANECWNTVVTSKLHLLARNTEPSSGHTDNKQYVLGRAADAGSGVSAAENVRGPYNDRYKRSVFEAVVRLENVSARRATP